ncbi:hypothetical protein HEK616_50680 [Streptomyces nigrescens]|uniref:Oxidoreductase n=1 Tax=Streptomyces nigrescens TaxID=1920 RepID=A0ABM7ZYX3_STRNI|nr:hypothetical protein HEK616_50680 [Streptomyces nigrescens]
MRRARVRLLRHAAHRWRGRRPDREPGAAGRWRPGLEQLSDPPEPVNFSAEWAHKDLAYAARMAGGLPHPVLDGVLSLFTTALAEGRGKEAWSTVNPTAAGS